MSTETACVVKVDYIGVIHHVLESTEEECIVPVGSTIKGLLQRLVKRHGQDFAACLFTPDGQLNHTVKVFLNNKDINRLQGLDTPITGKTQVYIVVGLMLIQGG